jgi:hypothetical protein
MKKRELDHVLRAAGRITGEKEFIIIGSQALHGKYPDLADDIIESAEVDLLASNNPERTEWLNAIGVYSQFHETFGYYADPVDEKTATLPNGWKARLVNLPSGDTEGVRGLCLEPHDLAIAKYVAAREKDLHFTRMLARGALVSEERLRALLEQTPVSEQVRERVGTQITRDFGVDRNRDTAEDRPETTRRREAGADAVDELEKIRARAREEWLRMRLYARERSPGAASSDDLSHQSGGGVDDDTTS